MLATALMILLAFIVVSVRAATFERERFVDIEWKNYVSECTDNNANECLRKYREKEFKDWQGFVLKVTDNRLDNRKYYLHAVSIFMKMEPAVYNDSRPDILLTLTTEALYQNKEIIQSLNHGDHIKFNSTLHQRSYGNIKDVMHFHLDKMQVIGHNDSIPMYTSNEEEAWIQVHVEDRPALSSEAENPAKP